MEPVGSVSVPSIKTQVIGWESFMIGGYKMKRLYLTTALAALVAAGPAFAQTEKDQSKAPDQAQGQQMNEQKPGQQSGTSQAPEQAQGQKSESTASTEQAGSIEFIASQEESDWLTSSLMGRNVQNSSGETLGDINDIILNEDGQVVAVLIGVGGFLGIGGKDVAVKYSALEFKERESMPTATGEDARQSAAQQNTTTGSGQGGSPLLKNNQQSQTTAEPAGPDADHSDMVIVLNATFEQLESAPAFQRLGEEAQEQSQSEPAEKQDKMETQEKPAQQ